MIEKNNRELEQLHADLNTVYKFEHGCFDCSDDYSDKKKGADEASDRLREVIECRGSGRRLKEREEVRIVISIPRDLFGKLKYHKIDWHGQLLADEFQDLSVKYLNRQVMTRMRLGEFAELMEKRLVDLCDVHRWCTARAGFAEFLKIAVKTWPAWQHQVHQTAHVMSAEERCRFEGLVQGLKARK